MSSSSATTTNSRSPSPESSDSPGPIDSVTVQAELDAAHSWFIPMHPKYSQGVCETDFSLLTQARKLEDEQMLCLDDLLEQHAFDDGAPTTHLAQTTMTLPSPKQQLVASDITTANSRTQIVPNFRPSNLLIPSQNGPISATKPVPPPASLPRKLDASNHSRVVHPPKESCFNLPIVFPSIPEGGTKSRVETQVRITVDLADSCSPSDPLKYDRVGSWKWLKLPPGTSTKRRTRKQGKIDADPQDTLTLFVDVVCASAPNKPVVSCSSCRTREAKRVAKKIAARVRPTRSDSESAAEDASGKAVKKPAHEDTNSIIQFNCAEILDFSTGSVVLPLRITCYCRHHREKVGFLVRFTMMDHINRIVGTGTSKPIMITDDHKTASANNRHNEYVSAYSGVDHDWSHPSAVPAVNDSHSSPSDLHGPFRRKDRTTAKKRPKPYDTFTKLSRSVGSREGSVSSVPSPSTSYSPLPVTRSPTPSSVLQNLLAASETISHSQTGQVQAPVQAQQQTQMQTQPQTPNIPFLQPSVQGSDSSSPDLLPTPLDSSVDIQIPELVSSGEATTVLDSFQSLLQLQQAVQSPFVEQPEPMSLTQHVLPSQLTRPTLVPQSASTLPFMFFDPNQGVQPALSLQLPTIHRLIPNMGPTFGGIEVTILGANFHPRLNLRCVFGETVASSTQRWSDNALVCVLPPREQPGVVEVWFEGFPKVGERGFSLGVGGGSGSQVPSLFTYSDESDRALMELALQVVGLKMTGKLEDAKNVAMRIVGNAGSDSSSPHNDSSNNMQLASLPSTTAETLRVLGRDFRSRLLTHPGETDNFESTILSFLSILDAPLDDASTPHALQISQAISHPTATGQTLLHLAAFMGFSSLVTFLVEHEADLDARDDNGFTPLHFASLAGREECVKVLAKAGADREIVDTKGRTAAEVGKPGFLKDMLGDQAGVGVRTDEPDSETEDEDEEADWGDAEDDVDMRSDEARIRRLLKRKTSRKLLYKFMSAPAGRGTPKQSMDISRVPTPAFVDNGRTLKEDVCASQRNSKDEKNAETKQNAWFVEMISRTLAQLPPAAGIVPTIPHLYKPQLPGLPDFSGVPWGYLPLPQFPMVFPVIVPPSMWPSFLGGGPSGDSEKQKETDGEDTKNASGTMKAMQEWRTTWEKWVAFAITMTAKQQQEQGQTQVRTEQAEEDVPPPEYTPRQDEVTAIAMPPSPSYKAKGKVKASQPATPSREMDIKTLNETPVVTATSTSSSRAHPVGYVGTQIPEEEIEAYTYQPPLKQKQKHKKHDRMLLLFWLPILLLSLMWAFHTGIRFAYQALRTTIPAKLQRT